MNRTTSILILCAATVSVITLATGPAGADERSFCAAVDDGTGTAELPPEGCGYVSPQEIFMIIDGLPPGTTIELDPFIFDFSCISSPCGQPGGILGGEVEFFEASMNWEATGTGDLDGFTRNLTLYLAIETNSAPRTPGDPVQSFDTVLYRMEGYLPPGDPDFDQLQVVAGVSYGYPSPGHTNLSRRDGGSFSVDSFFDVSYLIDFVGAPGGALGGLAGSTQGTLRIAVEPPPESAERCVVPDNGAATAELPPAGCDYRSPDETMVMADGLPPGTTIVLKPTNHDFVCASIPCGLPGGNLGGDSEVFDSTLSLELAGTGTLAGYTRSISLPATNETHSAPRIPGDPVQFFNTDTFELDAALLGDPDFDVIHITAGTSTGMPSPGQTILTEQGDGTFHVDSFFDISYQIDFVGAPGGVLDGLSGTTLGTIGMAATGLGIFADGFESADTTAWSLSTP